MSKDVIFPLNDQSGNFHSWAFWCEGCQMTHSFDSRWTFNGDKEKPTFSPSLLVKYGAKVKHVCHSFVRDGNIQYLNDCTHKLAGKTIPIKTVSEAYDEDER